VRVTHKAIFDLHLGFLWLQGPWCVDGRRQRLLLIASRVTLTATSSKSALQSYCCRGPGAAMEGACGGDGGRVTRIFFAYTTTFD
jgi:hypothetical protein